MTTLDALRRALVGLCTSNYLNEDRIKFIREIKEDIFRLEREIELERKQPSVKYVSFEMDADKLIKKFEVMKKQLYAL